VWLTGQPETRAFGCTGWIGNNSRLTPGRSRFQDKTVTQIMQRLIVTGPKQAAFQDVDRPACPADGVIVKARVTAISVGTEIRVFRAVPVDAAGQFMHERVPFELPTENGYSMVGEVVETGPEVKSLVVGDRVFGGLPHNEYAAAAERDVFKLPEEIPDEHAVFLNILEVGHISLRRGSPAPGENVAILGQGVIGLGILAYARAFGFRTIAIDPSATRLAIAKSMGADLAISPEEPEFLEQVARFCDGHGVDLVVEAASVWSAVETGMQIAASEARIVVAARHTDQPEYNPVGHPYLGKRLTLLTSYGHEPPGSRWDRSRSFALSIDLLRRGLLQVAPLITHTFDRCELPEVYARLEKGDRDIVGAVFRW
jgi:threonine dehydrogenase-like Zn-dependent dehydrogenase